MISLSFREQLPVIVANELDSLMTRISRQLDANTSLQDTTSTLAELQARVDALQASISAVSGAAEVTAHKDQASGYAGLTAGTKLNLAEMTGVMASSDLTNNAALEKTANRGVASGYASLDAGVRVVERTAPTKFTNSTTGAQNNLNFSAADTILKTNAALATISGIVAGYDGQIVILMSYGAGVVDLLHQSGLSSAGNKFKNKTAGTVTLAAGTGTAAYRYDSTDWTQLW